MPTSGCVAWAQACGSGFGLPKIFHLRGYVDVLYPPEIHTSPPTNLICICLAQHRCRWGIMYSLTLSQCTLAGPVYTGMPLECHWLTQCTLGYHWATPLILAGYTGTPLEKFSWILPTLGCHWRNSNFYSIHWNTTGGPVTAHTRPDTYSLACRVASMPVWNDKMAGHQ